MAVLCEMPTMQYLARRARLSVHKLFTSCIWQGLVSRDSIVDGDRLPATEWCQRYRRFVNHIRRVLKFGSTFRVRTVLARRMTLSWFQR